MKSYILSMFIILGVTCIVQQGDTFPHEHTGILNIDVASEFFYTELKRLMKVTQDPIFKRLVDLLYHHEVDNIRDILTVFAAPLTSTQVTLTTKPESVEITVDPIIEETDVAAPVDDTEKDDGGSDIN